MFNRENGNKEAMLMKDQFLSFKVQCRILVLVPITRPLVAFDYLLQF